MTRESARAGKNRQGRTVGRTERATVLPGPLHTATVLGGTILDKPDGIHPRSILAGEVQTGVLRRRGVLRTPTVGHLSAR